LALELVVLLGDLGLVASPAGGAVQDCEPALAVLAAVLPGLLAVERLVATPGALILLEIAAPLTPVTQRPGVHLAKHIQADLNISTAQAINHTQIRETGLALGDLVISLEEDGRLARHAVAQQFGALAAVAGAARVTVDGLAAFAGVVLELLLALAAF
jgi:hypothetical protein